MTSPIPLSSAEPPSSADTLRQRRAELVAQLFKDHNDNLIRFLLTRMRSRQDAKEVAQEAYVRLLNLDRPEAVSFLRAFLFKTAANLAIDRMRSAARREQSREVRFFDGLQDELGPERVAAAKQEIEIFMQRLSELPPKCRRAFLLNRVHGLRPATIAQQMGIAERTARHYVLRALLHCRVGKECSAAEGDARG